jgi:hypothetical protein
MYEKKKRKRFASSKTQTKNKQRSHEKRSEARKGDGTASTDTNILWLEAAKKLAWAAKKARKRGVPVQTVQVEIVC